MQLLFVVSILSLLYCSNGSGPAPGSDSTKEANQVESVDAESIKFLKADEPLILFCKLETKESVQIQWSKNNTIINENDERYKFGNRTLTIKKAIIEDDYGTYRCKTLNHSPPEHFDITVISLSYKKMPKSMTVLEGEKLKLECDATGTPMPSIVWYKDKEVVDQAFNESQYDLKPNEDGTPNGTLEILKAVMDDRGEYACFISSQGAQFNTTVFVRVKNVYAALWPFLGIVAEVVILCLIIFIYEKRRIKNDFEESDTDQPMDNKNPSDHNKDIRQRK